MVCVIIGTEKSATIAGLSATPVVLCVGMTVTVGLPSGDLRSAGSVPMAQTGPPPRPVKPMVSWRFWLAAAVQLAMAPVTSGMTR